MTVKVRVLNGDKYTISDVKGKVRVKDILHKLKLINEEYIIVRNKVVITEEDFVEDGDEIVLYPVVSGG